MCEEQRTAKEGEGGGAEARPHILVLTSDALFPHFFPAHVLARLEEVGECEHFKGREDSPELRERLARADALVTTWHSPFLRMEMLGSPRRVRLIAHCGGELKGRMGAGGGWGGAGGDAPGPRAAARG